MILNKNSSLFLQLLAVVIRLIVYAIIVNNLCVFNYYAMRGAKLLKNSLFVCALIFTIGSPLFSKVSQEVAQAEQDLAVEYADLSFLNPIISTIMYNYYGEDFITITQHRGDKPPPPRRYRRSSSSLSGFGIRFSFPIVASFSEYSLAKGYKTSASSTSGSREYTFIPNNEKLYSLLFGLKMGLTYDIFTTYSSFSFDIFSAMEGKFSFETKIGVDIAFPLGKSEVISLVLDPYFAMRLASANVGEIIECWTYSIGSSTYANITTKDVELSQFSFGIGALAGFKINFTDRFFITLKGGYKFYFANLINTFGAENYLGLEKLDLSGWEAAISINFF